MVAKTMSSLSSSVLRLQVESQLEKVKAELEVQSQHAARLESSCRALERSLGQSGKRLQVSRHLGSVRNVVVEKCSESNPAHGNRKQLCGEAKLNVAAGGGCTAAT